MDIQFFSDFIGQDNIKTYFSDTAKNGKVSHSYILSGRKGTGRKTLARIFASSLLCENDEKKPCGVCRSCKMAFSGNHPDLITLTHEKKSVISVDEIRAQLISTISVKPYYGGKKIYIIPECELLRQEAQNALLKSIEEPPDFAVIIMITDNLSSLLPTVRSRSMELSFIPLSDSIVKDYLMKNTGADDKEASVCAAFAGGSIGMALTFRQSETFGEDLKKTVDFIKHSKSLPSNEIFSFAKEVCEDKENLLQILDIMLFMYRDILMYKTLKEEASLTFIDETEYIVSKARETDYEELSRVIRSTQELKERLKYNANAEAALDVLLLDISV